MHSALTGITDRLESLLTAALEAGTHARCSSASRRATAIWRRAGHRAERGFERFLAELRAWPRRSAGSREVERAHAGTRHGDGRAAWRPRWARAFLNAQGIATAWVDARTVLRAERAHGANGRPSLLSATCDFAPDAALRMPGARSIGRDHPGLHRRERRGRHGAPRPRRLGHLGRLPRREARAPRLEIWTDVPGMFSANPRAAPTARLLRALHYDEAQEIASSGAKVLHPRCILPVRQYQIPLHVYATQAPGLEGTVIARGWRRRRRAGQGDLHQEGHHAGLHGQPRHVAPGRLPRRCLPGVQGARHVGGPGLHLRDQRHRVARSGRQHARSGGAARLAAALGELCRVEILGPCASLSLLGHNIRGILHELGAAFELFQDQKIYLVSQAANDLNFTFVIDEAQGDRLVQQLHERLIQSIGSDKVLGPTWQQLFAPPDAAAPAAAQLVGRSRTSARRLLDIARARVRGLRLRHGEHRRGDRGGARGASRWRAGPTR